MGADAHGILWNSTRTITNTINEYPLFSFLWGDPPHAHVLSLFVQALFIFLMLYILKEWGGNLPERSRWICLGAAALTLGVMPGTNSWDVLIYAPLLLAVGALVWYQAKDAAVPDPYPPWRLFLVCPIVSILAFAPYYLMLTTQASPVSASCRLPHRCRSLCWSMDFSLSSSGVPRSATSGRRPVCS